MKFPFEKGDWIAEIDGGAKPMFGRVKDVYPDNFEFSSTLGEWLIDLIIYGPDGGKIGRKSPACGGPTSYEPCISANRFRKIKKPDFPLKMSKFGGGWVESFAIPAS